jgi:hypothetical protein
VSPFLVFECRLEVLIFVVLHPSHKLAYFSQAGWDDEWRATAEEIVRAEFERAYADIEVTDSQNTQNVSNCFFNINFERYY